MSRADLQRFAADLEADSRLADEFGALGDEPEEWHRLAVAKGYQLTFEEARGLSSSYEELSDDELEQVAGGWDGTDPTGSGSTGSSGGS